VGMEIDAVLLICSDLERGSGGSILMVTNDSLFKMLADYCRQQTGSNTLS